MLLSKKLKVIFDYTMITLGSFICAIGLGLFLVEADIVPGGVTGISMIINFIWPNLSVGTWIIILNVPLFIWGIAELGNSFGVRTFYGFASNAVFIDFLRGDMPLIGGLGLQKTDAIQYLLTHDFFFFMLLGSILTGVGLGLIFKFKGTTAGTEIVCAIIKKRLGISPGVSMLFVDFFVIAAATIVLYIQQMSMDEGFVPAITLGCYALVSLYITSILLDKVVDGFDYARNMMIFSSKNKEISDFIMKRLDRGVTAFYARGLYTNQDREVLMTVVSPKDARELSPHIRKLDPNAFIILSNVHEVLGEGFRSREEVNIKFLKTVEKREVSEEAHEAAHEAEQAEREATNVEEELRTIRQSGSWTAIEEAEGKIKSLRQKAETLKAKAKELEAEAQSIRDADTLSDKKPVDDDSE